MKNEPIHYEQQLAKERESVINDLKGISVHTSTKDSDDWEATPTDRGEERADQNNVADKIASYEANDALVTTLENRLREIDLATNKLKDGAFGTCEVCQKEIEEDRLEANVAARTCKTHINEKLPAPQI